MIENESESSMIDHVQNILFSVMNSLPSQLVTKSDGYQVRWLSSQLATKSVGYEVRWLPNQLAIKPDGSQISVAN